MPILLEAGWGAIQLPANEYPTTVAGPLLEQVAEQVEEFHRRGYDTVLIGRSDGLGEALRAAGVPPLDQIEPTTASALKAFLMRPPPPAAKSSRKRAASTRR